MFRASYIEYFETTFAGKMLHFLKWLIVIGVILMFIKLSGCVYRIVFCGTFSLVAAAFGTKGKQMERDIHACFQLVFHHLKLLLISVNISLQIHQCHRVIFYMEQRIVMMLPWCSHTDVLFHEQLSFFYRLRQWLILRFR